ncbi:protein kinase activating protein dpb11 [Podospora pseudocomata]|uniref:Protein kinase activating protein dpb11 n=1 Tax=Podospora pseudocomata TaxID=2093779 RepID=A0ABR0G5A9_9PEZI|nr:protein kinase activating protein dpb11 [Podospora pseudocomata]
MYSSLTLTPVLILRSSRISQQQNVKVPHMSAAHATRLSAFPLSVRYSVVVHAASCSCSPGKHKDPMEADFDPAQPFRGVVICCTSIPPDLREDIASKTIELGGLHKYDLTPECTHLIVGNYDTAKYRHVARERPDIKPMATAWVEAVRDLWVRDAEIDFAALEKQWQMRAFERDGGTMDPNHPRGQLLCCTTGIEDPAARQEIANLIEANGGRYTGDLVKDVTHLIAQKPEGKKYYASKRWGQQTVSVEWVRDSVERGMILDERYYDPVLPPEERGVGAWNKERAQHAAMGKRLRENAAAQEDGKRKLRKTASMKLNSQRDNLWGDILGMGKPPQPETAEPFETAPQQPAPSVSFQHVTQPSLSGPNPTKSMDTQGSKLSSFGRPDESGVFASCCFFIHGFSAKKTEMLLNTVASLGGMICHSLEEVSSASGAQMAHRFFIIPQDSPPEIQPKVPENVSIITEFYIEKCLHKKRFFHPADHVIGRPFPTFPIPGFEKLSICTSNFTGVDLNQIDKSIRQLGARYEERFTADISILVCPTLSGIRPQKLKLALEWKIPVVNAGWLWKCISTGSIVPIRDFLFPELKQQDLQGPKHTMAYETPEATKGRQKPKQAARDTVDKDLLSKSTATTKPTRRSDIDASAFALEKTDTVAKPPKKRMAPEDSFLTTANTHFETAPTHHAPSESTKTPSNETPRAPLSEALPNCLNRPSSSSSASSRSRQAPETHKPLSRTRSEVADSEATDGDVGQSADTASPLHSIPEVEARKDNAEKLRAMRAEQERIALSEKLTSALLKRTTSTVIAAGSESAGLTADRLSSMEGDRQQPQAKRRKREILGRAISNVSAVSNISAASSSEQKDAENGSLGDKDKSQGPLVSSSQLHFEDPQSRKAKAALLGKLTGSTVEGGGKLTAEQGFVTIGDLGGYGPSNNASNAGAGAGALPQRRTARRR